METRMNFTIPYLHYLCTRMLVQGNILCEHCHLHLSCPGILLCFCFLLCPKCLQLHLKFFKHDVNMVSALGQYGPGIDSAFIAFIEIPELGHLSCQLLSNPPRNPIDSLDIPTYLSLFFFAFFLSSRNRSSSWINSIMSLTL